MMNITSFLIRKPIEKSSHLKNSFSFVAFKKIILHNLFHEHLVENYINID